MSNYYLGPVDFPEVFEQLATVYWRYNSYQGSQDVRSSERLPTQTLVEESRKKENLQMILVSR